MLAWNADLAFSTLHRGTGLLPVEAENQGKLVVTPKGRSGGAIPARCIALRRAGCAMSNQSGRSRARRRATRPAAQHYDAAVLATIMARA